MRRKGIVTVLAVGLMCFVGGVLGAAEEQEPPEDVTIESDGYKTHRRAPVEFAHSEHVDSYGVECDRCHHTYEGGANVWKEGDPVERCAECHNPLKSEGKVKRLQVAFHKNCKSCHRKLVQEGESDAAPYKNCRGCHPKES